MITFDVAAAVAGIVFVSAALQRALGFGFALLAVPLGAFVVSTKSAVVIVFLTGWVTSVWLAVNLRHRITWPTARRLIVGCAAGAPIGVIILKFVSAPRLRLVLGLTTCVAAVWIIVSSRLLRRGPTSPHFTTAVGLGLLSGVINTSLATSGPPLVYALRRSGLHDDEFRATISAVFVFADVVGLPLLAAAGLVTSFDLEVSAIALIPCILGMAVGALVAARMRSSHFVWSVDLLLFSTGVLTIAKALSS